MKPTQLQELAHQLLLSQRGKGTPQGEAPSAEELAQLLDGNLDFTRKQEVLSWINRSPELFKHWMALVEAKQTITLQQAQQADSLLSRFKQNLAQFFAQLQPTTWATAAGAMVLAVVYIATLSPSQTEDNKTPNVVVIPGNQGQEQNQGEGSDYGEAVPNVLPAPSANLATAFSAGYKNPSALSNQLPLSVQSLLDGCEGADNCEKIFSQVRRLGILVSKIEKSCEQSKPLSSGLKRDVLGLEINSAGNGSSWHRALSGLQKAVGESDQSVCREATQLAKRYGN